MRIYAAKQIKNRSHLHVELKALNQEKSPLLFLEGCFRRSIVVDVFRTFIVHI
jgi:hypothetical protein